MVDIVSISRLTSVVSCVHVHIDAYVCSFDYVQ